MHLSGEGVADFKPSKVSCIVQAFLLIACRFTLSLKPVPFLFGAQISASCQFCLLQMTLSSVIYVSSISPSSNPAHSISWAPCPIESKIQHSTPSQSSDPLIPHSFSSLNIFPTQDSSHQPCLSTSMNSGTYCGPRKAMSLWRLPCIRKAWLTHSRSA